MGKTKLEKVTKRYVTHYHTMPHFDELKVYSCGRIVRKGEIACYKHFLLFSQCFLPHMGLIFHFKSTLKCRRNIFFNLGQSGNGLTICFTFAQRHIFTSLVEAQVRSLRTNLQVCRLLSSCRNSS